MIELFQKGRACKIIFFIFAQKCESSNIPTNVLTNIQSRILMKTDSDFNTNSMIGTKETIEEYEYYIYLRNMYLKIFANSMIKSIGYTSLFYLWLRLLKHKGRKDIPYLLLINCVVSLVHFNTSNKI